MLKQLPAKFNIKLLKPFLFFILLLLLIAGFVFVVRVLPVLSLNKYLALITLDSFVNDKRNYWHSYFRLYPLVEFRQSKGGEDCFRFAIVKDFSSDSKAISVLVSPYKKVDVLMSENLTLNLPRGREGFLLTNTFFITRLDRVKNWYVTGEAQYYGDYFTKFSVSGKNYLSQNDLVILQYRCKNGTKNEIVVDSIYLLGFYKLNY